MFCVIRTKKALLILVSLILATFLGLTLIRGHIPLAQAIKQENYTVYLTFDDGPSVVTIEVLDILQEENVPATFFVIGATTERGLSLYNRILEEGHTLAMHSYSHDSKDIYRSMEDYLNDFHRLEDWIAENTGVSPKVCRMPGGSKNTYCPEWLGAQIAEYFDQNGYAYYDWDIDPKDWEGHVSSGELARRIIQQAEQMPNQDIIVLLHDNTTRTALPGALPQVIEYFRERGYTFAALDEKGK